MRALYVSHNGMLDNLGQSQVLPYVRGLARRGVTMRLLSFELSDAEPDAIEALRASLDKDGVHWTPLVRRRDPRLRTKITESANGVLAALTSAVAHRPDIVHGRSYLPTAIGDVIATLVPRARLLFDCRGMLGDEYVDAGYWTTDRIEYRLVKRFEARAFHRAEGVVVLTEALKRWIEARHWLGKRTNIEAIPCCVDLDRFHFDEVSRARIRREVGFDDRLVLVYAGSLGSWYCEEEVARLAGQVKRRSGRKVGFLLLTPSPPEVLVGLLEREGLTRDEIVVRRAKPREMTSYLSAGDVGISFITSCFSKKGSSPTKVAEYLACGLTTVVNAHIGDQADLAADTDACVVVSSFDDAALAAAADSLVAMATRPVAERVAASRGVADRRFGLERVGVTRYQRLYSAIAAGA